MNHALTGNRPTQNIRQPPDPISRRADKPLQNAWPWFAATYVICIREPHLLRRPHMQPRRRIGPMNRPNHPTRLHRPQRRQTHQKQRPATGQRRIPLQPRSIGRLRTLPNKPRIGHPASPVPNRFGQTQIKSRHGLSHARIQPHTINRNEPANTGAHTRHHGQHHEHRLPLHGTHPTDQAHDTTTVTTLNYLKYKTDNPEKSRVFPSNPRTYT